MINTNSTKPLVAGSIVVVVFAASLVASLVSGQSRAESTVASTTATVPSLEESDLRAFPIEATLGGAAVWPEISPCEFLRFAEGYPLRARVARLTSYSTAQEMADVRDVSGEVYTVAALIPTDGSDEVRIAVNGGRLSTRVSRTTHIRLEVGQEVLVFLNDDHFDDAKSAYWITSEEFLWFDDIGLHGPLGHIMNAYDEPCYADSAETDAEAMQAQDRAGLACAYHWDIPFEADAPWAGESSDPQEHTIELTISDENEEDPGIHLPESAGSDAVPAE
jgi:hypothetical protein